MIIDHDGQVVGSHQLEHEQILPRAGWVEHNPIEIVGRVSTVIATALAHAGLTSADLAAIGITNQRETTVAWNRRTGVPYANAIVWQDTRTDALVARLPGDLIRLRTGLLPATYFSGGKMAWLLSSMPELRSDPDAVFGTIDSWLLWNLTGEFATDVTNASRTMLMDLRTLSYSPDLLELFGIPDRMLPSISPSIGLFGSTEAGVPIGAVLGDQHAATIGQCCFDPGEAKNTYGTGNFLVLNTGSDICRSDSGLLTTVCYQEAGQPPVYGLEGSIAVTGAAVQWLRDQLGIIATAADSEALAAKVDDTSGLYFVPAFSGLFAPYWRPDARGAIVGMSRFHTGAHIARATLESICYQTRDVVLAMGGLSEGPLRVDGGVTANDLCMQLQADILGVGVSRPVVAETTALGAAYAAGLAVGFWSSLGELRAQWRESRRWEPTWSADRREAGYAGWKKAVSRTLDWVEIG
jgi:glycerol kinase